MPDFRDYTAPPVFIVGAARSGTTMLRLMLNNHPHLAIPFESGFIPWIYRRIDEYGDLRDRANRSRVLSDIEDHHVAKIGDLVADRDAILDQPASTYQELVRAIFACYAIRQGKRRWGDKTPGYIMFMDVLVELFPDCRIIHLVRDGRDVALSQQSMKWMTSNLPTIALNWRWMTTLGHQVGKMLGNNFLEIRYEDLVLDTEATLRRTCVFLSEPYSEEMLRYPEDALANMPERSLKWHARSIDAPDPGRVYRWRRCMGVSDRILFGYALPALELFGYEVEGHAPNLRSRLRSLYYGTVKRW